MSELAATPAVAVLAEESGAGAFRLDAARPVSGWGVLSGAQIWIWAMGLRTLQPGAAEDPFTYEAWVADRAGMLRSLGALGPAPGGTALATFGLDGDSAAAVGLVVTAQARGATRPTAVVLTGRVQWAEPAAAPAPAPESRPEPAAEPVPVGTDASGAPRAVAEPFAEPEERSGAADAPEPGPEFVPAAAHAAGGQTVAAIPPLGAAADPAAADRLMVGVPPGGGLGDPFRTMAGTAEDDAARLPWPAWPGAPFSGSTPLLRPLSGGSLEGALQDPPATMPPAEMPPGTMPPAAMPPAAMPTAAMPPATMPPAAMPPTAEPHIPRDPTGAAMHDYPAWTRPLRPTGPDTPPAAAPGFEPGPAAGITFMPGGVEVDPPADAPLPGAIPGAAAGPGQAADGPACPPGHVPVERAAVPLEAQGPLYGQGSGNVQLDFAEGGLLITLRGMPPADAMGQSGHTGRPYNAYRVWLQAGGTRQIMPVGMVSRVWTDTWRLQVRDGLPLRSFDTLLVTAEDRAGSSAFPAGPVLLAGHYRWYRPGP